jgi:hypothetical protein
LDEATGVAGVGGFARMIGPADAEVQLFKVTVMLVYVPAPRPAMVIVPLTFDINETGPAGTAFKE